MKSFIGWIGGKSRLKNQIISLIPTDCSRYIEVCGGAGWVLFGKEKVKGQMEVFNDVDGDLISIVMKLKIKLNFLIYRELRDIYTLLNVVLAAIETRLLLIQNQYAILLMSYQHTKKG